MNINPRIQVRAVEIVSGADPNDIGKWTNEVLVTDMCSGTEIFHHFSGVYGTRKEALIYIPILVRFIHDQIAKALNVESTEHCFNLKTNKLEHLDNLSTSDLEEG